MNANPKQHRRIEDRIAAAKAGKSLRIVVPGKCRVCKKRSADVPATKNQALAWFRERSTKGFLVYERRMLETGVHRDCQAVEDGRAPRQNTVAKIIQIAERADKARKQAKKAPRRRQKAVGTVAVG